MRLDKLTIKAQEALSEAVSLAGGQGHGTVEPAHLLQALLAQSDGVAVPVLQKLGVPVERLRTALQEQLSRAPRVSGAGAAQPFLGGDDVHVGQYLHPARGHVARIADRRRHDVKCSGFLLVHMSHPLCHIYSTYYIPSAQLWQETKIHLPPCGGYDILRILRFKLPE